MNSEHRPCVARSKRSSSYRTLVIGCAAEQDRGTLPFPAPGVIWFRDFQVNKCPAYEQPRVMGTQ